MRVKPVSSIIGIFPSRSARIEDRVILLEPRFGDGVYRTGPKFELPESTFKLMAENLRSYHERGNPDYSPVDASRVISHLLADKHMKMRIKAFESSEDFGRDRYEYELIEVI